MRGGGDHSRKSLVRDGTDIDHGEIVLGESGMQVIEDDPGLRDDIVLLSIDLGTWCEDDDST